MAVPEPSDLAAMPDPTGVTLTWNQPGRVDGWTVYCDPLDGSDTDCVFVTDPVYRFDDLAPGEHHFGVVAWHDAEPSPGAGTWIYAAVPQAAPGSPTIPVIVDAVCGDDDIMITWISQDVRVWEVRLLDEAAGRDRVLGRVTVPEAHIVDLAGGRRYGVQVRAIDEKDTTSAWSEPAWIEKR